MEKKERTSVITITKQEFNKFTTYIKANYGIYLKEEKQALLMGRLQNILVQKGFKSFSEYYDYLIADKTGEAASAFIDKVTTNHTFFMREADHFNYFRDKILPSLASTVKNKDLRIWSAGCSSGEEPYTLAMIIDEFFGKDKLYWDTKILATDEATKGVYTTDKVNSLPLNWKMNYFSKSNSDCYTLQEKIKKEVVFRRFNLMEQVFPFKGQFQVIFCRNVMIYFDTPTKNELVNKFYNCLGNGGYLFIGHSESLQYDETKFKYVMPAVYRKL
jgi:chemotaxis protein methyltransferase CheR